MKLSAEVLKGAVQNAHIEMTPEEFSACLEEVAFVLNWAKEMDKLPLEVVWPMAAPNLPGNCPTRPDTVTASMGSQQALAQAPSKLGSCFLVPNIMD